MYFDKLSYMDKKNGNGEWDNNMINDKKYMFYYIFCRNMVFWFYFFRILLIVFGVIIV